VPDYTAQVEAQHRIVMDIMALAERTGIEFAFPTRTVHLVTEAPAPHPDRTTGRSAKAQRLDTGSARLSHGDL